MDKNPYCIGMFKDQRRFIAVSFPYYREDVELICEKEFGETKVLYLQNEDRKRILSLVLFFDIEEQKLRKLLIPKEMASVADGRYKATQKSGVWSIEKL